MENNNVQLKSKSKVLAGVLGIILGGLGVHNFYLGYVKKGLIQLVLGICGFFTCGITFAISEVWGLVEGIMILSGRIDKDSNNTLLS
jgi:TM2 domain-containing membrane protein YozV